MNTAELLETALERHRAGQLDEAAALYREVLQGDPDNADALHLMGVVMFEGGSRAAAIDLIQRALAIDPKKPSAYNNLASILFKEGRLDEAGRFCLEAIRMSPQFGEAWYNLGNIRQDQRRYDEALECYGRTLATTPDHAQAHWNRALLWLLLGDYDKGWEEYEWRWRNEELPTPAVDYPLPVWDGSPLGGKTIFLYAEQGMGDAIQFIRYVPLVQELGGRVILGCDRLVERLFSQIHGIGNIVTPQSAVPSFTCHASLLSLPRIFGTRLETIPARVPYLRPDETLSKEWAGRLADEPGLKVGIVWRGNPAQKVNPVRSCPAALLESLARIPGVRMFSLQKDPGEEGTPNGFKDIAADLDDFADTAAAVGQLDVVISVCTSVAPLAGALGRPLWVMLAFNADWRWLHGRDDSPWYPTARLFRQARRGDWQGVVDRVASELAVLARRRGANEERAPK